MEAEDAGNTMESSAAASPTAASRFRLTPRAMLMAAAGALLALGIGTGGWIYFANRQHQVEAAHVDTAARARAEAEWQAAANSAENQAQLAAARKAHEEIMAADTKIPAVAAAPEPAPVAPAEPTPPPAPPLPEAPKVTVAPPPAEPPAPRPKLRPIQEPAASVANDPAPQRLGDCAVSGGGAKDFGAALGRCLEAFNRVEGGGGAEPSAANTVPARPARR